MNVKKTKIIGRNIKKEVQRKPYLERGRRVNFGQCKTCGVFKPKKLHSTERNFNDFLIFSEEVVVYCKNHGQTVLTTEDVAWYKFDKSTSKYMRITRNEFMTIKRMEDEKNDE